MGNGKRREMNLMESQLVSLFDVSKAHDLVFFDNCALMGYSFLNGRGLSSYAEEARALEPMYVLFEDCWNTYVTQKVLREFGDDRVEAFCLSRGDVERLEARKKFRAMIKDVKGVFRIEDQDYPIPYLDCLKEVRNASYYEDLGSTDIDLFTMGSWVARNGVDVAVVSNDCPLVEVWQRAMKAEKAISNLAVPDNYHMYIRRKRDGRCEKIGLNTDLRRDRVE